MREMKKFVRDGDRAKENAEGGFSLVELIIVVAIMAVLVGVVGTQVIPYIENTRQAQDIQILSAYATAGMSAYSFHADCAPGSGEWEIRVTSQGGEDLYICYENNMPVPEAQDIADELKELIAKNYVTDACNSFQSKLYADTAQIVVKYNFDDRIISVEACYASGIVIKSEHAVMGRL